MYALTHPRSATSLSAAVALAVAVVSAAVVPWLTTEPWWLECSVALTFAIAALAAVIDAETGRIPDSLVVLAVVPTLAAIGIGLATSPGGGVFAGPVVGALACGGPLLVVHVVSPTAMGFGDVKLAAALGAALGTIDPRAALPALCLATAVTAVVGLVRRRATVPLGPGLVVGSVLSVLLITPSLERAVPWR